MSDSAANPRILVNGEAEAQQDGTARAKMQAVLQQVCSRIRSEAGTRAPKSGVPELIERIREAKVTPLEGEAEERDETLTDEGEVETEREALCAAFERKLEASEKALREEFGAKVFEARAEMRAYTDEALKGFESKMRCCDGPAEPRAHEAHKGPDKKKREPKAAPPPAAGRGGVPTRTVTANHEARRPGVTGQRAKSETLSSSKGGSSERLKGDPTFTVTNGRRCKRCKPLLPAAYPPAASGQKNHPGQR